MRDLLLKIEFTSLVRIGSPGRDDQAARESVSAEQVFSWLSLGWIQLFGKEDYQKSVVEPFCSGKYPWIHTDLFPYARESMWLPTPTVKTRKDESADQVSRKHYKSWVPWDAFFKSILNEVDLAPSDSASPVETVLLNGVHIRRDKGEDNAPFYTATVVTSLGADSKKSRTAFAGILRCMESSLEDKIRSICEFMADFGMGGGRSSGLGAIAKVTLEELPKSSSIPAVSSKRGLYVLLSPCCPTVSMLDEMKDSLPGSNSYSISARAGWLYDENGRATDVRKPTVRSFDTGSMFSIKPQGRLVEVGTDRYPAYRYGIPFYVEA